MKKLLLGAALLGLCTLGQTARAGSDEPDYNYQRPAPRYEERVETRCYLPPPPVYCAPRPVVYGYAYPRYYHRRHFHPYGYGYGYGYGYAPGVHIGIGF